MVIEASLSQLPFFKRLATCRLLRKQISSSNYQVNPTFKKSSWCFQLQYSNLCTPTVLQTKPSNSQHKPPPSNHPQACPATIPTSLCAANKQASTSHAYAKNATANVPHATRTSGPQPLRVSATSVPSATIRTSVLCVVVRA